MKAECLDDYLEAARVADAAVKETEPGMLRHPFDQSPDDPLAFTWSEVFTHARTHARTHAAHPRTRRCMFAHKVYTDDAALLFHLTNPPLQKFVAQHGEMGNDFAIEIYGTLKDETKKVMNESGFPVKMYDTRLGYTRLEAEPTTK